MDFDFIIEQILKIAGLVDAVFFLAYAIDTLIQWFKGRKQ